MKNQKLINITLIVTNVILVAAVATFAVFFFKGHTSQSAGVEVEKSEVLPIAYLNTDSLLVNYIFAIEANEKLIKKQEDARLKLNNLGKKLLNQNRDNCDSIISQIDEILIKEYNMIKSVMCEIGI